MFMAYALWAVAMVHSMNRERKMNRMDDLIRKLSEIRSEYNCFNQDEEPYYRALSEAISILSRRADGDTIYRQAAIDALEEPCKVPDTWTDEYAVGERAQWEKDVKALNSLPSAERHGRWNNGFCSVCGEEALTEWNDTGGEYAFTKFCPHCGAKMDLEKEE